MEKMLVVIFDTETQAYEGLHNLNKLDEENSIAIYSECVIQKNVDGTIATKKTEGDFPIRAVGGTALGSLIGLLAGPVGAAVGAGAGFVAGIVRDAYVVGVDTNFVHDISAALIPGKFALLADIGEEWVTPVDSTMEAVGGLVLRFAKSDIEAEQRAAHIAARESEIRQLEAEFTHAQAARKDALRAKIDNLDKKLHDQVEQAKLRMDALKKEADAKVDALQKKAQKANRETKAVIEARITEIQDHHKQQQAKLRHATAAKLREAATKLEKVG